MNEFRNLSDEARQEIRDFVKFKKVQESSEPVTTDTGNPEEKP